MSSHSIKVSAIRSTVSIAYDDFGIPLIRAKNLDDLFFAQGFVSAKDRFFQMDMSRRAVSGRLSFLMGDKPLKPAPNFVLRDKSIVDLDRIMLSTGIKWAAEKSYEHLTPEEKEYRATAGREIRYSVEQRTHLQKISEKLQTGTQKTGMTTK